MTNHLRRPRPAVVVSLLALLAVLPGAAAEGRPLLITVDDLSMSSGRLHPDPAERERITRGMLEVLAKHGVPAVGLVTWDNVRDDADRALLELRAFLEPHARTVRFFRFPYLHEGGTPEKLETARDYLAGSGQRFRFATADEVLSDPAFAEPPRYAGPYGFGLWDRFLHERRVREAIEGVETLLREQAEAWSRGDLDAFVSSYAEDVVFVSPSGLTRGRDEVLERYRKRYPDAAAMGRLTLDVLEARAASGTEVSMLGDAVPGRVHAVSVVARWTLAYPDREPATGLTLLVLHRRGERWVIVQDASM